MQNISLTKYATEYFGKYLNDDNINEICYNGDNLMWVEDVKGVWHNEKTDFNLQKAVSFANASASFKKDKIDKTKPILSCILPTGERVQIVIPQATKDKIVSITIRKPSKTKYDLYDDYVVKNNSLDRETADFIASSVKQGKNIVICGETGSGKTTFMKTLIDFIPLDERIITIEDVEEIKFYKHKNFVQLFYPSEAKAGDAVTSATLLKSCLRMKPDRILLAEVRGAETYDFLNVISSGHNGSMTSCHAGSVKSCKDRLAMMSMQNKDAQMLGREMIMDIIDNTIDLVVVFQRKDGKRQVSEYLYEGKIYKKGNNGYVAEKECV